MKKVILNAYACSPVRGSEPGNGWSWALNIAKLGYEVWCVTNNEDKEIIESELKVQLLNNLHFIFVTVPYGLDNVLLNTSSRKIYLHYFLWRKAAAKVSIKLHKQFKYDIGHHVTFGSLQQGSFLWRLPNIKLIFGPVGGGQVALPAFKEYFGSTWKMEVLRSKLSALSLRFSLDLKKTLKFASHILVTNKETEDLIKTTPYYSSEKVHFLLDNAVPSTMSNLPLVEHTYKKKLNLLWVGRMLPRKGLNLVLHSLSFVPKHVDYHLTIVGGGVQFDLLDGWIKKYNLDPKHLSILGQIPFLDVINHYKISDAFIFCSLRDSCPAQINEAMAFGLPPIVLDIHGSALAVPNNCGIKVKADFPEPTAKRIADAIVMLYNDKELLSTLSKESYLYSKTNTWEEKVKKVTFNYYE